MSSRLMGQRSEVSSSSSYGFFGFLYSGKKEEFRTFSAHQSVEVFPNVFPRFTISPQKEISQI